MPKDYKVRLVDDMKDKLQRSSIAIGTSYQGLKVSQTNDLRKRLHAQGMDYKVLKNTLASIAAKEAGKQGVEQVIQGPTAMVFAYGDPAEAAKALAEHMRANRLTIDIYGAFLDGTAISGNDVRTLATLPPREELVARLLGQMQAPITRLLYALNGPIQGLTTVLQRRVEQGEGGAQSTG